MRRPALLALGILFTTLALRAADPKPPLKLPPDVQQAVGLAMAAPAEFGADALLRLAEGGGISAVEARKQLIETAFGMAGRAQHPFRLVAISGSEVDNRTAYEARALRLKLDATALQARAIEAMISLDKAAAKELYERMRRPSYAALTCEAALVPDATDYYALLTRLAQSVYTGGDQDKNSRMGFVQTVIDRMVSHAEIAPAVSIITGIDWKPSQLEVVAGAFLARMNALAADDRTFRQVAPEVETAISALASRVGSGSSLGDRIRESYRAYVVAQLKAPRCVGAQSTTLFNDQVRGGLSPLAPEESGPAKIGGEPKLEPYWQSDESKRVFEQCLRLRTTPEGTMLPDSARRTREWSRQLADFLPTLAEWKPTAEKSEADYYHQRAIVYEALLEITPPGDVRGRLLEEFVAFLNGSNVQSEDPVQWFWHARSTLSRVRTTNPDEARRLEAAYAASGNTVLVLEALLDRIAPTYSMFGN